MKRIISGMTAFLMAGTLLGITASAQSAQPKYPMHGNMCGVVKVVSEVEHDVHVTIVQNSPDGKYKYYDDVMIPADSKDKTYDFSLEGKNDVDYTVTIAVPKYNGAGAMEEFSEKIIVKDTDEITDQKLEGYSYTYTVVKNEKEEVSSQQTKKAVKSTRNIIESETTLLFPILDRIPGDVNGDGIVNVRDAAAIATALAKNQELPAYADFNGDGVVNIRDSAAIAKSLASAKS